jgi:hypothetical protein
MSRSAASVRVVETSQDDAAGPILHDKAPPSSDYAEMLKSVASSGGKTYFAQVREIYALKFGPGKLAPIEYFHYGLHEDRLSLKEKQAFVGHNLRAELNRDYLDEKTFEVGTDKLAFYARAAELGLPTPKTRAVCHAERTLAGAVHIADGAALAAFLRDPANYPFFAKPVSLTASVGTASATRLHAKDDLVEMSDGRCFTVERLVAEAERYFAKGWLIQERLTPHADIRAVVGEALSTVRMMVVDVGSGPQLIRATWRVPVGDHSADVLWRGNLMADVDGATGVAARAIKGRGLTLEEVLDHPDSRRPIVGCQLPMWREACDLALKAAKAFPELPITGWDVAITDRGPIIIELEPDGGDPAVTQLASGKGLLSGPYAEFLRRVKKAGKKR